MTLEEAAEAVGRRVIYRPPGWVGIAPGEAGVITEVRQRYVFVRYDWDTIAKATRPEDLELEAG